METSRATHFPADVDRPLSERGLVWSGPLGPGLRWTAGSALQRETRRSTDRRRRRRTVAITAAAVVAAVGLAVTATRSSYSRRRGLRRLERSLRRAVDAL